VKANHHNIKYKKNMNSKELSDILNLLDSSGGKYVVVEDGKPKYAIMDMEEYKKMAINQDSLSSLSKDDLIKKINKDIALWHETQNEESVEENLIDARDNLNDDTQYYYEIDREVEKDKDTKEYF
jgi:hypothetical protein